MQGRARSELWVFIQAVASSHAESRSSQTIGSGGCSCHETELLRGRKVACEKKGMRLAVALDKTCVFFAEQVAWLNSISLVAEQGVDEGVRLQKFVRSEIVRRTQASFVMVGEVPRYLFVDATDLTVANSILKSWRNLPRVSQHPVTVPGDCMLSRSGFDFPDRRALTRLPQFHRRSLNEQEVFRNACEAFIIECCVQVPLLRNVARSRIPRLFSSQRVSQTFQMICQRSRQFQSGGNCIRFEVALRDRWRVLQSQCRKQWQRVKKSFVRQRRARLPLG